MGVYLSTPNTELEGTQDGSSSKLVFGASSMQGWRVGQEDAHIAIADYDTDTSLFGVFDGHGGPEVAKYCAQHLPEFIKSLNSYQSSQLSQCLEEAFLKFDKSLTLNEVIQELKILSANPEVDNDENDTDDDINEAILLREEADLPISEVMKRYNGEPTPVPESECGSSTNIRAGLSLPLHMRSEKERTKPVSPFLRAKRSAINEFNHLKEEQQIEGQSSSSKEEVTSSSNSNTKTSDVMNTKDEPQSTAQTLNSENITSDSKEGESTEPSNGVKELNSREVSNGEIDSKTKQNDSNSSSPSIGSSDNKIENCPQSDVNESTNTADSALNESIKSSDSTPSDTPYKGKGKYKKIIIPKTVIADSTSKSDNSPDKPIYEYLLEDFDEEEEESDDDSEEFADNDESSDEELDDDSESDEEEGEESNVAAPCFERPGYDSGCTAVVALLKGDQLVVANAGDSRCVVSRDGKAVDMSVDHKPEDDIERERITKAGGKVTRDGRVNGGLNLSRAIGDHAYKQNKLVSDRDQMITALPDIMTLEIDPKTDDFMVIACDGIWNSMTSQQVIDFVGQRIQKTDKLSTICDELFRTCLAPNTHGDGTGCDNMTAVIVKFVSTNNKRKFDERDDNSNENNIDSTQTNDENLVSEEPQIKRTKSDEPEVGPNQVTVNEVDTSV